MYRECPLTPDSDAKIDIGGLPMIIKLPNLSFIYQPQGGWMITNTYSSSLGTDPEKGSWNRKIFCFKIYINGEAADPSIKAECYTQLSNMAGVKNYDQAEMSEKELFSRHYGTGLLV